MTPEQADQRIILSRQTLHRYNAMIASGVIPHADLGLMTDEISELERIAEAHPVKAVKAYRLGEEWLSLIASIRAKMN